MTSLKGIFHYLKYLSDQLSVDPEQLFWILKVQISSHILTLASLMALFLLN